MCVPPAPALAAVAANAPRALHAARYAMPTLDDPASGDLAQLYPEDRDYWVDLGDGTLDGSHWYVYRAGKLRRSCWVDYKARGDWYWLDERGEMLTGWRYLPFQQTTDWYYFNTEHDGTFGRMLWDTAGYELATYTVSFDANGGDGAPASFETAKGTPTAMPAAPEVAPESLVFDGWYTQAQGGTRVTSTTQLDSTAANGTATVYAHWVAKSFGLGSDNNAFGNVPDDFPQTYFANADDPYFARIVQMADSHGNAAGVQHRFAESWHGSCYGIAGTMGLVYQDLLSVGELHGTGTFHDLGSPKENEKLNGVISLIHALPWIGRYWAGTDAEGITYRANQGSWGTDTLEQFLRKLVCGFDGWDSESEDYATNKVKIFGFGVSPESEKDSHYVHAVLAMGAKRNADGSYSVRLYDENVRRDYTEMNVGADFKSFSFMRSDNKPVNQDNYKFLSLVSDWDGIAGALTTTLRAMAAGELLTTQAQEGLVVVVPIEGTTTVTLGGKTLTVTDGAVTGDLDPLSVNPTMDEVNPAYIIELPGTGELKVAQAAGLRVAAYTGEAYIAVEDGTGDFTANLANGTVSATPSEGGDLTVTVLTPGQDRGEGLVSEKIGGASGEVTVQVAPSGQITTSAIGELGEVNAERYSLGGSKTQRYEAQDGKVAFNGFEVGGTDHPYPTLDDPSSGDLAYWFPNDEDYWVDLGDGTNEGSRWYVYRAGQLRRSCWVDYKGRGDWYWLGYDGEMLSGWQQLTFSGRTDYYYLNPKHDGTYGKMVKGWLEDGGYWYYLNDGEYPDGAMVASAWKQLGGFWYYFDASGHMVTGERTIDGEKHNFDSAGHWLGKVQETPAPAPQPSSAEAMPTFGTYGFWNDLVGDSGHNTTNFYFGDGTDNDRHYSSVDVYTDYTTGTFTTQTHFDYTFTVSSTTSYHAELAMNTVKTYDGTDYPVTLDGNAYTITLEGGAGTFYAVPKTVTVVLNRGTEDERDFDTKSLFVYDTAHPEKGVVEYYYAVN